MLSSLKEKRKHMRLFNLMFVFLISLSLVRNVLLTKSASASSAVTPIDTYTGPALRLPWQSGSYSISQSYSCGDHYAGTDDQYAIDFGFGYGAHIQLTAVFAGTVHIGSYDSGGYGNNLWISNGTWRAVYAHLGEDQSNTGIQVTDGQQVTQGQSIAMSGWSGHVEPIGPGGAHLHFSLRSGGTDKYDGDPVKPEPMSGYTEFDGCSTHGSYDPDHAIPGGQWLSPTPADGTTVGPGATIHVNVRGLAQTGSWIDHIDVKWLDSGSYGNQTWSTRTNTFVTGTMQGDFSTDISAPLTNLTDEILVKFDVYNNLGNSKIAVQGIRRFCLTNSSCIPYATVGGTGGLGGGSNPTPTPTSGSGGTGSTCTDAPTFSDHRDGDVINTGSTTFHWNAPSSCTPDGYSFNVSPTSDPEANKIFGGGVGPTEYAYTFTNPGTYYISVRACKTCTPYVPGPWVTIRIVVQDSCAPSQWQVSLFNSDGYKGICHTFGLGQVNDLTSFGLSANVMSVEVGSGTILFVNS